MARRPKQQAASPPEPAEETAGGGWALWVRLVVSVWAVWHVFVVFISPFSTAPSSDLVVNIAQSALVRWYSDPLYMNHGYHFFGPDPPTFGTLIHYTVVTDSGREITGDFPNLQQQWPRLWYHRHMMLADQMSSVGIYGDAARERELMMRAYARHLLRKHDGVEVRLENWLHRSLSPYEVIDGADPSDERYFVKPDGDPRRRPRASWSKEDAELYEAMTRDPALAVDYDQVIRVVERRDSLDEPLVPEAPPAQPPAETAPVREEIPIGVGR